MNRPRRRWYSASATLAPIRWQHFPHVVGTDGGFKTESGPMGSGRDWIKWSGPVGKRRVQPGPNINHGGDWSVTSDHELGVTGSQASDDLLNGRQRSLLIILGSYIWYRGYNVGLVSVVRCTSMPAVVRVVWIYLGQITEGDRGFLFHPTLQG